MARRIVRYFSFLLLLTTLVHPDVHAYQHGAGMAARRGTVTISYTPGHPVNTFLPARDLGAGVDGHQKGDIAPIYRYASVKQMRSAGLLPLTYRLRTELGIEAWHWNARGAWSDSARRQGYWTSDAKPLGPIMLSNGYFLPRRGNTIDQADNLSYSRLDDGKESTFWKSNPYLDSHFTGESNSLHPQWVVVDFVHPKPVSAIRISWGTPYAVKFRIEYWKGDDFSYLNANAVGNWSIFPGGTVATGKGGVSALRLNGSPIRTRYVRIWLLQGSSTAPAGSNDLRDRFGFAIRELYIGVPHGRNGFNDSIVHDSDGHSQTVMFTSSTDPWHRQNDRDPKIEQPGFDRVFGSGLSNSLPVLMPVALLYDTPDNAAAELRYFRAHGYPVDRIEMGEEPDGQYMTPEDYGALYLQFAAALTRVDPHIQLGGPGLQSATFGWRAWPNRSGDTSWVRRFLAYLRNRGRLGQLSFFSFEWYPFDDVCGPSRPQLLIEPELLGGLMAKLEKEGLPHTIPWMITEYGYSSFAAQQEVDMPAALLNAEIVGQFLTLGGNTAYLYGYEPDTLIQEVSECKTWGNVTMFLADDDRNVKQRLPTYYGAWLLTHRWAQPGSMQPHELYPATSSIRNTHGQPLVTAYAVRRPDATWALLLINKDPDNAFSVRPEILNAGTRGKKLFGTHATLYQYGSKQFVWHPSGENGHADPDLPPSSRHLSSSDAWLVLPPYSLTVLCQDRAGK